MCTFSVRALPSPPSPASGGRGRKGSSSHLVWPRVHAGTVPPGLSEPQAVSNTLPPHVPWKQLPWSHSEALSCVSGLWFLHVCSLPLARTPLPQWRAAAVLEKKGLKQAASVRWGAPCCDYRKPAWAPGYFQSAAHASFPRVSKCVPVHFRSWVLASYSLLISPLVFKQAKHRRELIFPMSDSTTGEPNQSGVYFRIFVSGQHFF